jgi:hypothetical protein
MSGQAYFALRALRGGRWPRALGSAVPATAVALVAGGGLAAAVPTAATVAVAVGMASAAAPVRAAVPARRGSTDGLTGIAREWARAHPWRFAAGPAVLLAAALLSADLAAGWPTVGAALAGLVALGAPRFRTASRTTPVRASSAMATRRLAVAPAVAGADGVESAAPRPSTAAMETAPSAAPAAPTVPTPSAAPAVPTVPAASAAPGAAGVEGVGGSVGLAAARPLVCVLGVEAGAARGNFREMPGVSPIAPRRPRSAS